MYTDDNDSTQMDIIRWEHDNDVYGYRWIRWDGKMIFVNVQYNKVIQVKS